MNFSFIASFYQRLLSPSPVHSGGLGLFKKKKEGGVVVISSSPSGHDRNAAAGIWNASSNLDCTLTRTWDHERPLDNNKHRKFRWGGKGRSGMSTPTFTMPGRNAECGEEEGGSWQDNVRRSFPEAVDVIYLLVHAESADFTHLTPLRAPTSSHWFSGAM